MVEPVPCLNCPRCHANTVLAVRTVEMANQCHCTACGFVWDDDPVPSATSEVTLRPKQDRRGKYNIH